MKRGQQGAALLLVLWVTVLLAALLLGIAASSRSHSEAALYGSERVRAGLAAQAGLAHAVAGIRTPDPRRRWVPDGRAYHFDFDGAKVTVRVVDVTGLMDLNASTPQMLDRLFVAAGADAGRALQLSQAVVDRRSRGVAQPGGAMGAPANRQAGGPFKAIDQLARLPGMQPDLYAKLVPAVTVQSGRNFPDASYAGTLVMAALRGESLAQARTAVADRRRRPARSGVGNGQALDQVAGGALVAGYGGNRVRVFSDAGLPDGTSAQLDTTIMMALTVSTGRPYKVLDWRHDPAPGDN